VARLDGPDDWVRSHADAVRKAAESICDAVEAAQRQGTPEDPEW